MFEILGKNADPSMTAEEIESLFEQHEEVCEAELDALTERVKKGEDKKAVIDEIYKDCDNKAVAEFVVKRLNEELNPFEETRFLREMEFKDFKKKIIYIFENTIFRSETKDTINLYMGLDEDQIRCMIKLANTILHYYMVQRYTQNSFSLMMRDAFGFNKVWIEALWNYCEENEEKMRTIITMRCYSMLLKTEKSINSIYQVFTSVLDENDDDE